MHIIIDSKEINVYRLTEVNISKMQELEPDRLICMVYDEGELHHIFVNDMDEFTQSKEFNKKYPNKILHIQKQKSFHLKVRDFCKEFCTNNYRFFWVRVDISNRDIIN